MSKGNSGLYKGTKGSVADEWGWLIPDSSPSPAYIALVSGKKNKQPRGASPIGMVLSFGDADSANSSKVPSNLAWHGVADDQDDDEQKQPVPVVNNDNEPWHQVPAHDDNEPWQQVPAHDDGDDGGDGGDNNDGNNDDGNDDDSEDDNGDGGTNDNNDEGGDENNDSDEEQDDYRELESHMHLLVMEWAQRKYNELPKEDKRTFNTACIVFDEATGKYYYGRNRGYLEAGYEKNPILFGDPLHEGILPAEKLNDFPVGNCAEVDATNRALNAGSKLENLFMLTIYSIKKKFGQYKESCENCTYTFLGRIKHNFSGWRDIDNS